MNPKSPWTPPLALGLLAAFTAVPQVRAQTITSLYSFGGADGNYPAAPLIQATDGNLYGTTAQGGSLEYGTLFKITADGSFTSLFTFCASAPCREGAVPNSLVQASDANLYGTTVQGGAGKNVDGTFFRFVPGGTLTTLHSFVNVNGLAPYAGVIQATNGNFYGTAREGGIYRNGTVFKITPAGNITTLYSFCAQTNCTDGSAPNARLIQASDGSLYGTTENGGAYSNATCKYGCGTIFKITPEGELTTLYSFCAQSGCPDGEGPAAGLIQATNKALYGTTNQGGNDTACLFAGCGTIFKITLDGVLTTLHVFNGKQGASPGELIQATDGTVYGTTYAGGANGTGTVFAMRPSGRLTLLHTFCAAAGICPDGDGAYPRGALVQETNGDLYGTTTEGGLYGLGTVFRLSVGLGPFVTTQTPVGSVGESIVILGNELSGTMSVTFNGVAAAFTVVSASEITATVPARAQTGYIDVQTPAGTLTSNIKFRVKN